MIIELRRFSFDMDNEAEAQEYDKLCTLLKSAGYEKFEVISVDNRRPPSGLYSIDTKWLFSNQYNAALISSDSEEDRGFRIFDWYEDYHHDGGLKTGHYIVPFTEGWESLQAAKHERWVCSYCGTQYVNTRGEGYYCLRCRGSEFLEPKEYWMLRLRPLMDDLESIKGIKVPDDVLEDIEHQKKVSAKKREERKLSDRLQRLKDKIAAAKKEHAIFKALIEAGYVHVENVIFYEHSNTVCFGWRNSIAGNEEELRHVEDALSKIKLPRGVKTQIK